MHHLDPSSVRCRATVVTLNLVTPSRRNTSTMFYGHREAAVSLQNAQYVQPVSQLVPSSPSGYRKLIKEAHKDAVPSDCEKRQMGDGAHTSATVKHVASPAPERWPLALSPTSLRRQIWGSHNVDIDHSFLGCNRINDSRGFESAHRFHLQWMSRQSITRLPGITTKQIWIIQSVFILSKLRLNTTLVFLIKWCWNYLTMLYLLNARTSFPSLRVAINNNNYSTKNTLDHTAST